MSRTAPKSWLSASCVTIILLGCAPPFRVHQASDAYLKQGLPLNMGLAYGRIVVRGWRANATADYTTSVEFRSRTSGQTFTHRLNATGEFHWVLRTGGYEITDVLSGLQRVSREGQSRGIYFDIPPGRAVYLGELYVQLPSEHAQGRVHLVDDFNAATNYLRHRYPSLRLEVPPQKQLFSTWK